MTMLIKGLQNAEHVNWLDYGLQEYQLVVQPDKTIAEKITAEKEHFAKSYRQSGVVSGQSFITLARFLGTAQMEDTAQRWIQNICHHHTPFLITLHAYSGIAPHILILQIQNVTPFKRLANHLRALDPFIRGNECPPLALINRPYLPLARHLPERTYFKALHTYLQRPLQHRFIAKELLLVKRSNQLAHFQVAAVLPFFPEQPLFYN
jgi:hypothetical protein